MTLTTFGSTSTVARPRTRPVTTSRPAISGENHPAAGGPRRLALRCLPRELEAATTQRRRRAAAFTLRLVPGPFPGGVPLPDAGDGAGWRVDRARGRALFTTVY